MAAGTSGQTTEPADCTLVCLVRHGQTPLNAGVPRGLLVAFDAGLGDPDTIPQDNGCFNTLELRGDSWIVLSVNELPAEP